MTGIFPRSNCRNALQMSVLYCTVLHRSHSTKTPFLNWLTLLITAVLDNQRGDVKYQIRGVQHVRTPR